MPLNRFMKKLFFLYKIIAGGWRASLVGAVFFLPPYPTSFPYFFSGALVMLLGSSFDLDFGQDGNHFITNAHVCTV